MSNSINKYYGGGNNSIDNLATFVYAEGVYSAITSMIHHELACSCTGRMGKHGLPRQNRLARSNIAAAHNGRAGWREHAGA